MLHDFANEISGLALLFHMLLDIKHSHYLYIGLYCQDSEISTLTIGSGIFAYKITPAFTIRADRFQERSSER